MAEAFSVLDNDMSFVPSFKGEYINTPHPSRRYEGMDDTAFLGQINNATKLRFIPELERWNKLHNDLFVLNQHLLYDFPVLFFKNHEGNLGYLKIQIENDVLLPMTYSVWTYEFNLSVRKRRTHSTYNRVKKRVFTSTKLEVLADRILSNMYSQIYAVQWQARQQNYWISDNSLYQKYLDGMYFEGGYMREEITKNKCSLSERIGVAEGPKTLDANGTPVLGTKGAISDHELLYPYKQAISSGYQQMKLQEKVNRENNARIKKEALLAERAAKKLIPKAKRRKAPVNIEIPPEVKMKLQQTPLSSLSDFLDN